MSEHKVVIPYKPRDCFREYHETDKRFCVTVAHRRAGKTVARINKLIRKAVECKLENPRFGYIAPYYVQAKDIAWLYLKHYAAPIIAAVGGKVNESELSITFGHNNAMIRLYGAENAERMRGLYFDGIVPDEAQGMAKSVLTSVILPSLADRKGWLDVSGTPKGWANLLGELVRLAQSDPDNWFLQLLPASQTGILDEGELARQRALLPENEYAQEFEISFDAAITGAVYGKWVNQAITAGRMRPGLYDPKLPVHTAWDLGYDDATAIWFWQQSGREIRLIEYYENNGQDIRHYIEQVIGWELEEYQPKKYKRIAPLAGLEHRRVYAFGNHYVPHDAANELLAAGGRSIVQQAWDMGVKMCVVPATSQQNGIEAARKTLEQTWIDDACKDGVELLKSYQFEFDEDKKIHKSKPRHDHSSHAADAFEIIGQVHRHQVQSAEPPKPRFLHEATFNDIIATTSSNSGGRI